MVTLIFCGPRIAEKEEALDPDIGHVNLTQSLQLFPAPGLVRRKAFEVSLKENLRYIKIHTETD